MMLLRQIGYILACQFYCLRLVLYGIHSLLVFLTKPGARLVIPLALIGLVYAARDPLKAHFDQPIGDFWSGAMWVFLGSDLYRLLEPFRIELTALAGLLGFALVFALLSSMMRPVIGTFAAPKQPLPPLPPLSVPDTRLRTVKATLVIPKRGRNRFRGELSSLIRRLPDHLQAVVNK